MRVHVLNLRWKGKEPYLLVRNGKEKEKLRLEVGEKFKIRKTGVRKCIGYFHKGGFRKCPLERTVDQGNQCSYCRNLDSFWPCVTCNGEECKANPRRRKNCLEKEHAVYLASFGKIVKVGVTRLGRIWERWIEQGADYGVILEKANGKEARKIESGFSDIRDRVFFEEKFKELGNLKKEAIQEKIEKEGLKPETRIYSIYDKYPRTGELENVKESKNIGKGVIKGIKGWILIYKNNGDLLAYNLKNLRGEVVEII